MEPDPFDTLARLSTLRKNGQETRQHRVPTARYAEGGGQRAAGIDGRSSRLRSGDPASGRPDRVRRVQRLDRARESSSVLSFPLSRSSRDDRRRLLHTPGHRAGYRWERRSRPRPHLFQRRFRRARGRERRHRRGTGCGDGACSCDRGWADRRDDRLCGRLSVRSRDPRTTVDISAPASGTIEGIATDGWGYRIRMVPRDLPVLQIQIFHVEPDSGIVKRALSRRKNATPIRYRAWERNSSPSRERCPTGWC
jgi:hypothetical protein